ncbi:hypothetical protein VDG1235_251 [Verrucomicrobiia bacterium DG1235]|nr:hypothetical protein VDG1235_251 [Verrucomicrobiae bacterium DG1235]
MKLAAKIAFSILTLTALGFCVAFVLEEIWLRASGAGEVQSEDATAKSERTVEGAVGDGSGLDFAEGWRARVSDSALDEIAFADRVLREGEIEGGLLLAVALEDLGTDELEGHFVELMARDLDDYRAVDYAGRVLQEIAEREPELGVALLSALTPAEKERLVASVARGWTMRDPAAAFAWIGSAWLAADGGYIDREVQNGLFVNAMDALVTGRRDYELAAATLAGLADPELRAELTDLVAHRIVRDGPEAALDRLAAMENGVFDGAILDAVAQQWAARDSVGAAGWVLENEEEVSSGGVRSIAKHLSLAARDAALTEFHGGLAEVEKRDSVAAEAARLKARREPTVSADWVLAIERPDARQRAVFDALYEIGYEDFGSSVNYIDYVYTADDAERAPVVYSTLRDWLAVDLDAVAGYLGSGRAHLSAALSEELLGMIVSGEKG